MSHNRIVRVKSWEDIAGAIALEITSGPGLTEGEFSNGPDSERLRHLAGREVPYSEVYAAVARATINTGIDPGKLAGRIVELVE